jgi:hypothetical protein
MNNSKLSIFGSVLLLFVIPFVPLMSAELSFNDFNEFFQDNVTQLTITIHQDESQANLYLNTEGTSFDTQSVSCSNLNITDLCNSLGTTNGELNFKVSDLLNGINGQVKIENGFNYPQFDILSFSHEMISISPDLSVSFTFLINRIFSEAGIPLNTSSSIPAFNEYLALHPLSTASDRNIIFTKEGNYYTLWNDQGYGDIDNYKNRIRQIISENVEQITITDLLDKVIPIINETSAGSGDTINNLLEGVYLNYTVGAIDLSSVQLKDGTYDIPVFIQKGNTTFTKNITLILQGIQNEELNVPVNGTYTPINPEVAYYIIGIDGLGNNIINISLFDIFSSTLPSNSKSEIKYLNISISNSSSGTIKFKVPVADVSNPLLLSLYVLENDIWSKLSTTYLTENSGFYEFSAQTPHFSIFMIMETLPPTISSGGGGGNGCATKWTCTAWSACTDGTQTRTCNYSVNYCTPKISKPAESQTCNATIAGTAPIQATPSTPTKGFFATITGAVVGTLGTGGAIVVIAFIVSVVGLVIILRIGRKAENLKIKKAVESLETKKGIEKSSTKKKGKRRKKLNEKSDKNDT